MAKIIILHPPPAKVAEPGPVQSFRRPSAALATILAVTLAAATIFTVALAAGVLWCSSPFLTYGPGGLWIGFAPNAAMGRVGLGAFSFFQRACGAAAVLLLMAGPLIILAQLHGLFRVYAMGCAFAPANARKFKILGLALFLYALAPALAHYLAVSAGLVQDPIWFHMDEIIAATLGALLLIVARVMVFGGQVEQDRDGFV